MKRQLRLPPTALVGAMSAYLMFVGCAGQEHRRQGFIFDDASQEARLCAELQDAVTNANQLLVRQILSSAGPIVFSRECEGALLQAALESNNTAILEVLFLHGFDVDFTRPSGITLLMDACASGQKEAVALLLRRGAKVNARQHQRGTALMFAAAGPSFYVWRRKRAMNAGQQGNAPIAETLESLEEKKQNYIEIVKLLLAHGARPRMKMDIGDSALDVARSNEQLEILKLLQKHRDR